MKSLLTTTIMKVKDYVNFYLLKNFQNLITILIIPKKTYIKLKLIYLNLN